MTSMTQVSLAKLLLLSSRGGGGYMVVLWGLLASAVEVISLAKDYRHRVEHTLAERVVSTFEDIIADYVTKDVNIKCVETWLLC